MPLRTRLYILIAACYVFGFVCLSILVLQANLCKENLDSIIQLLETTGHERGRVIARILLLSLLGPTFGAATAFFMALYIMVNIFRIIKLVKIANPEKLRLMYAWLCTHACYIMMTLVGFFSSLPVCTPTHELILTSGFSSIFCVLVTLVILLAVESCKQTPQARPNRNTQEVSQNTTSSEAPPIRPSSTFL
jgi:hypothetical protein